MWLIATEIPRKGVGARRRIEHKLIRVIAQERWDVGSFLRRSRITRVILFDGIGGLITFHSGVTVVMT